MDCLTIVMARGIHLRVHQLQNLMSMVMAMLNVRTSTLLTILVVFVRELQTRMEICLIRIACTNRLLVHQTWLR